MDKLSQLREMRERNAKAGRVRSLVNPRTLPSPQAIKAAADRAQARSTRDQPPALVEILLQTPNKERSSALAKPSASFSVTSVTRSEVQSLLQAAKGKTTKMSETAAASEFDKSGYMKLYQRVKRAKTDEDREAAETALREAFPNKRPRGSKLAGMRANATLAPKVEANVRIPRKKPPKPLRSMKALKRGLNGKKSRKAQRAKKKKGRR